MAQNKTQPTRASVKTFIDAIENERRRKDAHILLSMMGRASGFKPKMWGDSIVGFGRYQYKYESGHEDQSMLTGFAPRKAAMTIYVMPGFKPYEKLLAKLGKHKTSVSCLYINRLDAIDLKVLEHIISDSVDRMKSIYPDWSK